ncbi:flagellin [Escherichia coli]|uniref:Flagellin n=1 Tax=Escherichia coli TaxID=562 RepID=A0A2X1NAG2_ECOLX|nr:flagellin [Escherichia coli]
MAQVINTNSLSLITQNNINKNQSALVEFYRASVFWLAY